MNATDIIKYAKKFRGTTFWNISKALDEDITRTLGKMTSKNMTSKNFAKIMEALGYYVIAVPVENIDLEKINGAMRLTTEEKVQHLFTQCPHCGHPLTKQEQTYVGCPYCMTKWDSESGFDYELGETEKKEKKAKVYDLLAGVDFSGDKK